MTRRERLAQEIEVGKGSREAMDEELDGKKALLGTAMDERGKGRNKYEA